MIANSGWPTSTRSPTSAKHSLTMPEICDFTWISCSGTICPVASALSVIVPRSTLTRVRPSFPALPELVACTAP